jgi:hypothetical protein
MLGDRDYALHTKTYTLHLTNRTTDLQVCESSTEQLLTSEEP